VPCARHRPAPSRAVASQRVQAAVPDDDQVCMLFPGGDSVPDLMPPRSAGPSTHHEAPGAGDVLLNASKPFFVPPRLTAACR
jgi:hypothetical protein